MNKRLEQEYGSIETMRLTDDSDPIVKRETEVAAVQAMVNPSPPPARTKEQHRLDMLKEGRVECLRCLEFKHHTKFSPDKRNTERLGTYTICQQCNAERVAIKDQIRRTGRRDKNYQYRAHRRRKTRRRTAGRQRRK